MTPFISRSIIAAILLAAAGSAYGALAHGGPIGASAVSLTEVGERDKTRTSAGPENGKGAQWVKNKPNASRRSLEAEGRGFEPPTPCGAPDFESGCWPIRLPSGPADINLYARPGASKLSVALLARKSSCNAQEFSRSRAQSEFLRIQLR